jgi:hypothetical protein
MAEEKSELQKFEEEVAAEYREAGEAVDEAVEENREEDEKYYAEQQEAIDARERAAREYQLGLSGGVSASQSAAGPVEEVQAERSAELAAAGEDSPQVESQDPEGNSQVGPLGQEPAPSVNLHSPSTEEESEEASQEDDSSDEEEEKQTAEQVIDSIEAASSVEEVDSLAEGDERVTVQRAADKRKEELSSDE